jgi:hypothetical protein
MKFIDALRKFSQQKYENAIDDVVKRENDQN